MIAPAAVRSIVSQAVGPVMRRYRIPGMAVGATIAGRRCVFDYDVASRATREPVRDGTLFEIGSITKTFTASLASYAQLGGELRLSDAVSADYRALRGTSFDRVRLADLGTHTAGGLPLQFPDGVATDADAVRRYARRKPAYPAGTRRLYSNPSVMLLGVVAAARLRSDFEAAMRRTVFAPLGLRDTFFAVPAFRRASYAQGYTGGDAPRRSSPGPLAAEAYGIRTTAADMLRFVAANTEVGRSGGTLRRAIVATHRGYDRVGAMTQDLVREQYAYPSPLAALLRGNSESMLFEANAVAPIVPPSPPRRDVRSSKTGSTAGFAAYVALVPAERVGIVRLANKAYPIEARVAAAYRIVTRLAAMPRPRAAADA